MDTSVAYEMSKSSDENSTFCAMEITPILNFVVTTNQWNMEKIMENQWKIFMDCIIQNLAVKLMEKKNMAPFFYFST